MYGKLFESTFTGSMCGKGAVTFAVWCYAIAHTQTDSMVELNPIIIAAILGCDVAEVEKAIAFLCSEDHGSRTESEGGRRLIEEGRFLYRTVNWAKYNSIGNNKERREYNRLAKQRSRAKLRESSDVKPSGQQQSANVSLCMLNAVTETEDTEEKKLRTPSASFVVRSRKRSEQSGTEEEAVEGLDPASWQRWLDYRKQIGKAIKPASMLAAKRKLAAFGHQQSEVVEQSIANGWQGLFDVRVNGAGGPRRTRYEESQARLAAWKPNAPAVASNPFLIEVKR